jgi:hypothetical protein
MPRRDEFVFSHRGLPIRISNTWKIRKYPDFLGENWIKNGNGRSRAAIPVVLAEIGTERGIRESLKRVYGRKLKDEKLPV